MLTEENFEIEENIVDKMSQKNSNGVISNSEENSINENNNESISKKDNIEATHNNIIINDSLQLYPNQNDKKQNIYLDSEEVFMNLKLEIQKMKKKNELFSAKKEPKQLNNNKAKMNINNEEHEQILLKAKLKMEQISNNNNKEDTNEEILAFSLNDNKYFEYSHIDNQYEEESVLEDMDFEWNPLNEDFPFSYKKEENEENSYHFMEMNNKALRVIQEIDYDENGLELNINFNLVDKSELWIFTMDARISFLKSVQPCSRLLSLPRE